MVTLDIALPLIAGFLPALAWLIFFSLEDRLHPEPKRMVAKVFIVGILSAAAAALIQILLQKFVLMKLEISDLNPISLISLSFIEEFIKFAAVYFTIKGSRFFDEPVDAMIYMITGALGFAAIENSLFLFQRAPQIVLEIIVIRSVGATLLHALASGFVGFYWAHRKLILGLTIATLLHGLFNYLISQFSGAPIYATAILIFASFFLFYDFDIIKQIKEWRIKRTN